MRRLTPRSNKPEQLPMYAANVIKMRCAPVPLRGGGVKFYLDELGKRHFSNDPVWYFDLYYVTSRRKYTVQEMCFVQARTKQLALDKIKKLWRVTRID